MSLNTGDRYAALKLIYGEGLIEFIRTSKILVVGAGGIGCELLKNLVLSGFENIEIIDLDTIDISNLNRQFLFRQKHVGESKSKIAKETALTFNSACNIIAHHGNIKHSDYGLDFFKQFKIVINALDNIDARRHVNRLRLAANVPLFDGGTAGYLGQAKVYQKGYSACYECGGNRNAEKTFAVCTIRSNPSKMIHCVVWAKLLFDRLFGAVAPGDDISSGFEEILKENQDFENKILNKVFVSDIIELSQMKDKNVWSTGKIPEGLTEEYITKLEQSATITTEKVGVKEQRVWTIRECVENFKNSVITLKKRRDQSGQTLSFDKDDEDALVLVTSASNLRAFNFHIPPASKFDIKSMAGNIVPAIATTNAIVSGFLVCEAFKTMKSIYENQGKEDVNHIKDCVWVDILERPITKSRKQTIIFPLVKDGKNSNCYVCSSNSVTVVANCDKMTLQKFVEDILKSKLALVEPSILANDDLIYECGEDLEENQIESIQKRQQKTLKELGIGDNTELLVEDFSQDITWKVFIKNNTKIEVEEFSVDGGETKSNAAASTEAATPIVSATTTTTSSEAINLDEDDGALVCTTDQEIQRKMLEERRNEFKRKREEVSENLSEDTNPTKVTKPSSVDEDAILIDDE